MATRRVRLSTRFLTLFKGIIYTLLSVALVIALFAVRASDWLSVLIAGNAIALAFVVIKGVRKLRAVTWEESYLFVADQADIIILPEEIKSIELKMLIGVHEATLNETHPYLGDSFLFLASVRYLFAHDKVDNQMHELRQYIDQSKRELMR